MNSEYRYQLERYRGRGTRYIDTHNGNTYVNERVEGEYSHTPYTYILLI